MSTRCDIVQKNIYRDFIISDPGQKLVYREFTSVTSMHEKTNRIHKKEKKKPDVKYLPSYKNINMNKLISSTFLYRPPFYCLVFPTNGKGNQSNEETASPYLGQRSPFIWSYMSFASLIKSPSLPLSPERIFAINGREIHVRQQ